MKRIIIVAILLPCMLAVSLHAMYRVDKARDNVLVMTQAILDTAEQEDPEQMLAAVGRLQDYWSVEQEVLCHYIRHNQMEAVSQSIFRLAPFARYGEWGELLAEVHVVRWLISDICDSEAFSLWNIF